MKGVRPGKIDSSRTDGEVLTTVGGVTEWAAPAETGVASITGADAAQVDSTDPAHPIVSVVLIEPLTTEVGGVPDLVWDDDNRLVMTEVP